MDPRRRGDRAAGSVIAGNHWNQSNKGGVCIRQQIGLERRARDVRACVAKTQLLWSDSGMQSGEAAITSLRRLKGKARREIQFVAVERSPTLTASLFCAGVDAVQIERSAADVTELLLAAPAMVGPLEFLNGWALLRDAGLLSLQVPIISHSWERLSSLIRISLEQSEDRSPDTCFRRELEAIANVLAGRPIRWNLSRRHSRRPHTIADLLHHSSSLPGENFINDEHDEIRRRTLEFAPALTRRKFLEHIMICRDFSVGFFLSGARRILEARYGSLGMPTECNSVFYLWPPFAIEGGAARLTGDEPVIAKPRAE
jgi:hypothetical protein